jgi:AbrB family looped-hinge helix DNA binding protein
MTYETTITSKGTITIAAPLRKALGFKPGQKVRLSLDKNRQVLIDGGTTMEEFEALRARIVRQIPDHKKGLAGEALREAAATAWVADHRD